MSTIHWKKIVPLEKNFGNKFNLSVNRKLFLCLSTDQNLIKSVLYYFFFFRQS